MIELHYASTPNGYKVTIFLEETGTPYKIVPVDIRKGEQFKPDFLRIAPNNRIPAILDLAPADGGTPISIFESCAILEYLGDKTGRYFAKEPRKRAEIQQWLFWQAAGQGPMVGQANHFLRYAPERIPYPTERYVKEVGRLYAVLDRHLADRAYVAGDEYTIADMAIYPWAVILHMQNQRMEDTPHVKRWIDQIAGRPAVTRSYAIAEKYSLANTELTDEARKVLLGQGAEVVRTHSPAQ